MKILITGAGGQVGRALMASAPEQCSCRGLTRGDLEVGDLEAVARVLNEVRPDLLINAAAYTAVDRAEDDESAAFAVNAHAVGALASGMRALGGKFVHISTDFVFDGESGRPYRPSDPCRPLSVYGRSKLAGEELAGDNALIVRTSWVYAAEGANFMRTMVRLMRERDEVRVVADQVGAPTWAPRLAQVIWRLALAGKSGIFHYSDAGAATWYDFAVAIAEEAEALGMLPRPVRVVPIPTFEFGTRAARPGFSLLDSSATMSEIELRPVHWRSNLRTALRELEAIQGV